jgi:hypothetical protein
MTAEPAGPSYILHEGQQIIAGSVGSISYIRQHVRETVAAHALDGESVRRLLNVYIWTTSAKQAAGILQARHSVVLTAPPGSGRWSAAVAAITQVGATPHRIDLDPEDARRDLPTETGCGYILDIDQETFNEIPGIGEILTEYGLRLAMADGFLVVTATTGAWTQLQGRTSFEEVSLSPPSAVEIFHKHLTRTNPADVPSWAWDSEITELLSDASPADAVRLADLARDVLSTGSDDPVGDTIAAYGNWSGHLGAWFGKHSDAYHRALLIAAAALGEARTETVFGAADDLAARVNLLREPGGGLAGEGVAGLIGKIEAKEVGNGRISLRRPAYPESVLDLVWQDRPHLRTELKKWLTELPGNLDLDDPATENAGYSLIKLAIRHDDDSLIKYAANSWATGRQTDLAAVALTEAALNASTGRAVRRHMYEWADRATTDLRLQLTIANVCGGPFGKNYPRNAMTRLRRLAIHGGPEVRDQVAIAITELAREPHLRVSTLREVVRWATDDPRLQDPGIRSFLQLAGMLADQLSELPGREERNLLTVGWRAALHDPSHAEAVRRECTTWLEAVAQDRAPRETALTILADACQSSLDIGTLCTMAAHWSQEETEPASVSRFDVASAFLKLIGDRDPLTPGLTPTQIHPLAEENYQ